MKLRQQIKRHKFAFQLLAVAALAVGLRLTYAFAVVEWRWLPGDSLYFYWTALNLAKGDGFSFIDPALNIVRPSAEHPPLFTVVLAVVTKLSFASPDAHRAVGCLIGGMTVIVVGLLAKSLGGKKAGLIAASTTAVYVPFIQNEAVLMSESLYGLLIAVVLLQAVYVTRKPTSLNLLLLGVTIGLSALTRPEALLLILLLGLPLTLRVRGVGARIKAFAVICLSAGLVIGPWAARNWVQFDHFVPLGNNSGSALAGANCDETYRGTEATTGKALIGSWSLRCAQAASRSQGPISNEAKRAKINREVATEYVKANLSDIPRVASIRILRTWGLYKPNEQINHGIVFEGQNRTVQWAGFVAVWLLVLICLSLGLQTYRKDRLIQFRDQLIVFLAPLGLVLITSAAVYGIPRFRVSADIALLVFAALLLSNKHIPQRLLPEQTTEPPVQK